MGLLIWPTVVSGVTSSISSSLERMVMLSAVVSGVSYIDGTLNGTGASPARTIS